MLTPKMLLFSLLLLYGTALLAQNRTITGKVVSAKDNTALVSATISVKGTTVGTSTASDGSFSISAPAGKVTLQVSTIGFVTKEQVVESNQNNITINLMEGSQELGEVVVTALGIQRQAKTLVYATQSVKAFLLKPVLKKSLILSS